MAKWPKLPWKKCERDVIKIERFDHGVDKRLVLSCAKCKQPLGEQISKTLFLNEDDSDE